MGVNERRERERADLRERIVDAARDLFAAEGYEAVGMRRIAEAIEYSPTAIYGHFRDKAELFRGICLRDFAALTAAFRGTAGEADPVERIRLIGHAYIRFAVENPNHYRLMFMTPHLHGGGGAALADEELPRRDNPDEDSYAFLRAAVAEADAAGRFRRGYAGDVELVAQTLWAGVHGVASLQIAKQDDPWVELRPLEDRARAVCDSMLDGLTNPAPKPIAVPRRKSRKKPASTWIDIVKR